jgi:hypothetical protein
MGFIQQYFLPEALKPQARRTIPIHIKKLCPFKTVQDHTNFAQGYGQTVWGGPDRCAEQLTW